MELFGWLRHKGDRTERKPTAASCGDGFTVVNWTPPAADAQPADLHRDVPQFDAPQVDLTQAGPPDLPDFDIPGSDW